MSGDTDWVRFRVLPNTAADAPRYPWQVVDYGLRPLEGPLQGGRRMSLHDRDEEAYEAAGALNYQQGNSPLARLERAATALQAELPADKEPAVAFGLELARALIRAADALEALACQSHNFGRGI